MIKLKTKTFKEDKYTSYVGILDKSKNASDSEKALVIYYLMNSIEDKSILKIIIKKLGGKNVMS